MYTGKFRSAEVTLGSWNGAQMSLMKRGSCSGRIQSSLLFSVTYNLQKLLVLCYPSCLLCKLICPVPPPPHLGWRGGAFVLLSLWSRILEFRFKYFPHFYKVMIVYGLEIISLPVLMARSCSGHRTLIIRDSSEQILCSIMKNRNWNK